jgi:putative nucleotidyltransferase with HDIG domain
MQEIREWFTSYTRSFQKEDKPLEPLLDLKLRHSFRVAREAGFIAREMGLDAESVDVAETLGLLHDVGRFPQYREYRTFYDAASVDHGELGWKTVKQSGVLEPFEETAKLAVLDGIRFHNKKEIPSGIRPSSLAMVKLIRDADKLDVFELVQDHLDRRAIHDLLPRIPETGEISCGLLDTLRETGRASYSQVRSVPDFLLVQLSWVFDLNFQPSFRRVLERRVIDRIENWLPPIPEVKWFAEKAREFVLASAKAGEGTFDGE